MRDHLGEFYDKTSDFQQKQFDTLVDLAKKTVPAADVKSLIDIGSGTGSRTLQCFDHFPYLTRAMGVEPDWEMFAIAEKSYSDPRVTYKKIAGEEIDKIAAEQPGIDFDMALSNRTLHWLNPAQKDGMMAALNTVTKSGAWFMFNTCERPPPILATIDNYIRTELRIPDDMRPFFHLDAEGWTSFLKKHGWDAVEVMTYDWHREAESADSYVKHYFTSSTTRFMYGRHLAELSPLSYSDLLMVLEASFPTAHNPKRLAISEDSIFVIARKI